MGEGISVLSGTRDDDAHVGYFVPLYLFGRDVPAQIKLEVEKSTGGLTVDGQNPALPIIRNIP